MKKVKVTLSCCLCGKDYITEIDLPDNWAVRYDTICEESSFCDDHFKIAEWADSQCRGCVGDWQDCSLWTAFAYRKHDLTQQDFDKIARGICPKRVNGTFMFEQGKGTHSIDLSEIATTESGECLVKAIKDMWERFKD